VNESVFSQAPPQQWLASNALAFALPDRYPVSPGHCLVISRRVVRTWWDATSAERLAILELIDQVKALLDQQDPRPDGYNVGFNAGEVAGQTVPHLHVHVIPRYEGDLPDPRGGIRHVIPRLGNYLQPPPVTGLRDGPGRPLSPTLLDALGDPRFDRVDIAVSFIMTSGLDLLEAGLGTALERPGVRCRILTTDYLGITEKPALERLLTRMRMFPDTLAVRVFSAINQGFHPKAYLFWSSQHEDLGIGFVGSANVSRGGLLEGVEWTLLSRSPEDVREMRMRFDGLWTDSNSIDLSPSVLDSYMQGGIPTRVGEGSPQGSPQAPLAVEMATPARPTPIQEQALAALEQTRAEGFGAGLVVMATGLGKTWVAAFDSARPWAARVLFLAHREELLRQARSVFGRVQPLRVTAWLGQDQQVNGADVVFATTATMVRRLDSFPSDAFDYIFVDEFHHAAAPTYRRILGHFEPRFLLGLTATPDRNDGADLLALCEDNLVFEAPLSVGIETGGLVPFRYFGVPDTIDFAPIPWRSGGFDPEALEHAAITAERAQSILDSWFKYGADRTLAFCVSVRHAEYMTDFFNSAGVAAAAVHASPGSAPRHETLDSLARGDLQVVFAVDLFNEGTDVPLIDTVLMLRPTQSPVLFMQQIGRGLRRAEGKDALNVIDFVGNHRSFLMKPRLLLGLTGKEIGPAEVSRALTSGVFELPTGCSVNYELQAMENLRQLLLARGQRSQLEVFVQEMNGESGVRPTAVQAYRAGLNPASARSKGGWFALLDEAGLLSPVEQEVVRHHDDLLRAVATGSMTKSYKMVVLRALTMDFALGPGMSLDRLSSISQRIIARDPRLAGDAANGTTPDPSTVDAVAWAAYWRKWPVAAWLGELKGEPSRVFTLDGDRFTLVRGVRPELESTLNVMTAELVDWRLARYLDTKKLSPVEGALLRVLHNGRTPILFLDRARNADLPAGRGIGVVADGRHLRADFVKVAVNVVRESDQGSNVLPELLWTWFGPNAGMSGTDHRVRIRDLGNGSYQFTPERPHDENRFASESA